MLTDNRHRLIVNDGVESLFGQPVHRIAAIRRIPEGRVWPLKRLYLQLDVLERMVATLVRELAAATRDALLCDSNKSHSRPRIRPASSAARGARAA